jgi:hypothetical protein
MLLPDMVEMNLLFFKGHSTEVLEDKIKMFYDVFKSEQTSEKSKLDVLLELHTSMRARRT